MHRQILLSTVVNPSTHASHSISHFPSENQTPLSPSSSFSLNHLHNHSFPQFQLNASCFLPSLLHSPFSSFISLIHSPSLSFHSHSSFQNQSSSQCISLSRFSNPFSVSLSFHSHSSFQNLSSLHCISLSSSSNLFSIIHTFHSHSSFQKPSSSHCISIQPFQSLLQHSHIHSLFPFPFSVYKPIMIAVSLFHDTNPFYTRRSFHSHSSFQKPILIAMHLSLTLL